MNCDLFVSDLITTSPYKHWNPVALQSYLCDEDQRLVSQIYLSQTEKEDKLIWSHTRDGNYTVSSGYKVARHAPDYLIEAPPIPYGDPILKDKVWKLNIMPKLNHFLWRILSKAIGTTTRLNSRGMNLDPICQRCGLAEETIDHCFFTCPDSICIWRLSNLPFMGPLLTNDSMDNKIGFLLNIQGVQSLSLYQRLLPFWLLWRIWKKRNFLLFRKQILQPNVIVDNACADVREWISHLCSSSPTVNNTSVGSSLHALSSWKRPDQGFLKCNYDAAYDLNSNQVRGAWIIRNCYGHPYMWGSANLGFANSSLVAETMALLVAMQNAWIGGYSDMIFEGDSEILVTTINDHLTNPTIQNLLEEINRLKNRLSTTTFTFVKRNGNQAAHEIVRHGPANSIFENCKVYPPKWLTPTLYSDIMLSY